MKDAKLLIESYGWQYFRIERHYIKLGFVINQFYWVKIWFFKIGFSLCRNYYETFRDGLSQMEKEKSKSK